MDIRSKLGLYKENQGKKVESQVPSGKDVQNLIPGVDCANDGGSFYLIENRYPLSFFHGGFRLGEALEIEPQTVSKLCAGSTPVLRAGLNDSLEAGELLSASDFLFLDTETTGLSGGTGTVAFLVGAGCFEAGGFVIRQLFMRDYHEEPAMLHYLKRLLDGYKGLVTFNGRAFDWNLLQGRFIFNRMRLQQSEPRHLDLLYPSRRIWGLKLESCRLSSLEENILGEHRTDDIPGELIPTVYFNYLEERDASDIRRVIRHNELDILSMVSLLIKMTVLLESPLDESDGEHELLGLGRIFEARGEMESGVECFESCVRAESFVVRDAAVKRLSGIYKRNGDYRRAVEHWQRMMGESGGFSLFPLVELAKYYEHKERNAAKALEMVEKALESCLRTGLHGSRHFADLRKRRERLLKKGKKA